MKSGAVHDLVLVNVAGQPVRPAIYFYDRGRNLIDPESVVDGIGDLAACGESRVHTVREERNCREPAADVEPRP